MNNIEPLISCICVTSNRPVLLQRAIACFENQTYANKELVLSYPRNDILTKAVIDQVLKITDAKMIVLERDEDETLGNARNQAIEAANGEFICIWDDDDWYHNDRVLHQYESIKDTAFKASIFLNILLYDFTTKEAYLSPYRMWEGTLFCEKELFNNQLYLDKERGEDTAVVFNLYMNNVLFNILESSYMYVYIYHGNNTWGESHFNLYFLNSIPLDEKVSKQIAELTKLDYYRLQ
ncbi:glycosyltransferase [Mucilaginibacter sp. UR6-11]|uniref:glycosyltransferase family 2 protein n=1 Tax=Mucilaginibacter sp. UR6-11 TaxID=1435644 RepID=UPI0021077E85|nr:glycosyltransferase [Mucilaginibacter sp. UR6-11]MCC8423667.1 glycosyltransferase [Mucilaginibacter sp. UR6-11]